MAFPARLALLLILTITTRAAAADPLTTWAHVRADDPLVDALLARGALSPTFASLRDRIEHSDVIVMIERQPCSGRGHGGTQFLTEAGGYRYLRVTLRISRAGDPEAALLGHELRHVVELIDANEVRDEAGYRSLYQRIGMPATCRITARCYDTTTARDAGMSVYEELREAGPRRGSRPTPGRTKSSW